MAVAVLLCTIFFTDQTLLEELGPNPGFIQVNGKCLLI